MRLRTIGLICTLVLGLLAGPLPAEAQKHGTQAEELRQDSINASFKCVL